MPIPRQQLRLTQEELDELLSSAHEIHVATVSPGGMPHVVPMWFVWHEGAVWTNSLIKSRRTRDLRAGSPVAVCADTGTQYEELRGVVFRGRFAEAAADPGLAGAKARYSQKYWDGVEVPEVRSHVWLKLLPDEIASWDFRKIPRGRDSRIEARKAARERS